MELLVVIAIIAVLVAIAIPMLASQLEKSREATDLANVRSAYAQVSAAAMLGDTNATAAVDLKQRTADWQSVDPVNIGGIVHSRGQPDTNNWIGTATPGGSCVVSYSEIYGVVLTWSGSAAPSKPDYPFDTSVKDYFSPLLYAANVVIGRQPIAITVAINNEIIFFIVNSASEYLVRNHFYFIK